MKNTIISLAFITACSSAAASELYNGRLSGMSGAGYVTSDYSDGVLLNPSLAAAYGEDDDFAFVLNAGALVTDKDKLIDAMDDLVDYTDYLSGITNAQDLDPSMADKLTGYLQKVDNKNVSALLSSSIVVAIPNNTLSAALVVKASGVVGVHSYVAPGDYVLIDNAVNTPFDPDDLQSSVTGRGALIKEVGVALAKTVVDDEHQKILVGVTPKRVTVKTIIYTATVAGYDEDDLDSDAYTKETSATNLDAGITYIEDNIRYGLVIADIMNKKYDTITTEKYKTKTKTTASVGYSKGWLTAEADYDLNATPAFGLSGDTQMLRAGVDLHPLGFLHVRAGFARDTKDTLEDTYSFGLGFFNILDLSVFTGSDRTRGAALGLGARF